MYACLKREGGGVKDLEDLWWTKCWFKKNGYRKVSNQVVRGVIEFKERSMRRRRGGNFSDCTVREVWKKKLQNPDSFTPDRAKA